MRSFALLRTNPKLSTNVKLMVSDDELYLESINARRELARSNLKGYVLRPDADLSFELRNFWSGTPSDLAYYSKPIADTLGSQISDYSEQFETLYWYGARTLKSKLYQQEFQYMAPIYIQNGLIPESFMVFRVDGPGKKVLDRNSFKTEILNKLKLIKEFDMSEDSNIGQLINENHLSDRWPEFGLYWDWQTDENCRWIGIDYHDGGLIESPAYMASWLKTERRPYDMEQRITLQYQELGVVEPKLLNLCWMFDDSPSDVEYKRTWSINRYYGFYVDSFDELETSLTFYENPEFDSSLDWNTVSVDQSSIELNLGQDLFMTQLPVGQSYDIYYLGSWYTFTRLDQTNWEVTGSDQALEGLTLQQIYDGSRLYEIDWRVNPNNSNKVELVSRIGAEYGQFGLNSTVKNVLHDYLSVSDVVLQEIGDVISDVIVLEDYNVDPGDVSTKRQGIFINMDGTLSYSDGIFSVRRASTDLLLELPDSTRLWPTLVIKACRFTDLKDFDYDRIDTNYSLYEYFSDVRFSQTEEPKQVELLDQNESLLDSLPARIEDFAKIDNVDYEALPRTVSLSSEYSLSEELWSVLDGIPSEIWNPQQTTVKWGYLDSLSHATYPYPISNSFRLNERYNKGVNVRTQSNIRGQRTLDWFLTGLPDLSQDALWHSLHIDHIKPGQTKPDYSSYSEGQWTYFSEMIRDTTVDWTDIIWGKDKITGLPERARNPLYSGFHGDQGNDSIWTTLWRGIMFKLGVVFNSVFETERPQYELLSRQDFSLWKFSSEVLVRSIDPDDVPSDTFLLEDGTPIPLTLEYNSGSNIKKGVSLGLRIMINEMWQTVHLVLIITVLDDSGRSLDVKRDDLYDLKKLSQLLVGEDQAYIVPYTDYCSTLVGGQFTDANSPVQVINSLPANQSLFNIEDNVFRPELLSASYLIYSINSVTQQTYSMPIKYEVTDMTGSTSLYGPEDSPYVLFCRQPRRTETENSTYIEPFKSDFKPYFSSDFFSSSKVQPYTLNYYDQQAHWVSSSYRTSDVKFSYRHSGPYAPIFKSIKLFKHADGMDVERNAQFDTESKLFGLMTELNILKKFAIPRTINETQDIIPRLDLSPYGVSSRQIFKSSWDPELYKEFIYYRSLSSSPLELLRFIDRSVRIDPLNDDGILYSVDT